MRNLLLILLISTSSWASSICTFNSDKKVTKFIFDDRFSLITICQAAAGDDLNSNKKKYCAQDFWAIVGSSNTKGSLGNESTTSYLSVNTSVNFTLKTKVKEAKMVINNDYYSKNFLN